jgi:CRP/FNR family cyclic AMP-dependent transcriptional regulator
MKEEIKYWYLRNHKLFDQLSDAEVDGLCIISSYKQGSKNELIFFSESDRKRLYTIKQGILKICYTDKDGKEVITEILTEHDIFGCTNINDPSAPSREEYAKVLSEEVRICSFEVDNFKTILQNNPDLSIKYSSLINDKLVLFQQKYSDLIFKDVNTRVTDFFKTYARHHARKINNALEMEMILTHQEIADYTASSRQSVTSIINKLVAQGKIIYEGRKKVIIPDLAKL